MKDALQLDISLFVEQLENMEIDLREMHADQSDAWKETARGRSLVRAYHLIREAQLALIEH